MAVFEMEKIQSELSSRSIEWVFNCPVKPSEGGVWERMVQCVKRVLRHTLKEVALRDHVLKSLLIEAENIVNSRPLTHVPVDAEQEAPLCRMTYSRESPICWIRLDWMPMEGSVIPFLKEMGHGEVVPKNGAHPQGWYGLRLRSRFVDRQWCKGIVEEVYSEADGVVKRAKVRMSDNGLSINVCGHTNGRHRKSRKT